MKQLFNYALPEPTQHTTIQEKSPRAKLAAIYAPAIGLLAIFLTTQLKN